MTSSLHILSASDDGTVAKLIFGIMVAVVWGVGALVSVFFLLAIAAANVAVLRSLWTHAPEPLPQGVRTLVLALGREPVGDLAGGLAERGLPCMPVGDCRGARSLEEAILEGTTAGEQPPVTVREAV